GDEQTAARDVGREPLDECGDIGILEPDPHLGRRPAVPGSLLRHRCSRKPEYPLGKAPCQFVARRLASARPSQGARLRLAPVSRRSSPPPARSRCRPPARVLPAPPTP